MTNINLLATVIKSLATLLFILNLLDTLTTIIGTSIGFTEMNPLMQALLREIPALAYFIKIVIVSFIFLPSKQSWIPINLYIKRCVLKKSYFQRAYAWLAVFILILLDVVLLISVADNTVIISQRLLSL